MRAQVGGGADGAKTAGVMPEDADLVGNIEQIYINRRSF